MSVLSECPCNYELDWVGNHYAVEIISAGRSRKEQHEWIASRLADYLDDWHDKGSKYCNHRQNMAAYGCAFKRFMVNKLLYKTFDVSEGVMSTVRDWMIEMNEIIRSLSPKNKGKRLVMHNGHIELKDWYNNTTLCIFVSPTSSAPFKKNSHKLNRLKYILNKNSEICK